MNEGSGDDDVQGFMARLAEGDRRAFTPLYARLWPLCVQRARRLVHDAAEAEDVAQRALLTLFAKAAAFDQTRSATGWALALTDWEARTSVQKQRRRRESPMEPALAVPEGDVIEHVVVRRDLVQRLADAALHLSAPERATLAACFDDDAGPRDAGFRKRKQRVVERLRALFRSDG